MCYGNFAIFGWREPLHCKSYYSNAGSRLLGPLYSPLADVACSVACVSMRPRTQGTCERNATHFYTKNFK